MTTLTYSQFALLRCSQFIVIPSGAKRFAKRIRFPESRDLAFCRGLHMRDEYIYYVYIMHSASRRALYIGMTSNLRKRVWQHKNHRFEGFADDYNCTRLVYWESFDDVANAIDREKQLKRWRREKKMWLIERRNPRWQDLAADWYASETQGPSTAVLVHSVNEHPRSG